MQDGAVIDLDPQRFRHIVRLDFSLSPAKRPGSVVDLANPDRLVIPGGEQAVAFGEEVLERTRLRRAGFTQWPVHGPKLARGRARMHATAFVPRIGRLAHAHLSLVIRKAVPGTRRMHDEAVFGIEREEINAPPRAVLHVGAHVHLERAGRTRNRRKPAQPDPGHEERNHGDVRGILEGIEFQGSRNQLAKLLFVDLPVQEEKVAPGLFDRPGSRGRGMITHDSAAEF